MAQVSRIGSPLEIKQTDVLSLIEGSPSGRLSQWLQRILEQVRFIRPNPFSATALQLKALTLIKTPPKDPVMRQQALKEFRDTFTGRCLNIAPKAPIESLMRSYLEHQLQASKCSPRVQNEILSALNNRITPIMKGIGCVASLFTAALFGSLYSYMGSPSHSVKKPAGTSEPAPSSPPGSLPQSLTFYNLRPDCSFLQGNPYTLSVSKISIGSEQSNRYGMPAFSLHPSIFSGTIPFTRSDWSVPYSPGNGALVTTESHQRHPNVWEYIFSYFSSSQPSNFSMDLFRTFFASLIKQSTQDVAALPWNQPVSLPITITGTPFFEPNRIAPSMQISWMRPATVAALPSNQPASLPITVTGTPFFEPNRIAPPIQISSIEPPPQLPTPVIPFETHLHYFPWQTVPLQATQPIRVVPSISHHSSNNLGIPHVPSEPSLSGISHSSSQPLFQVSEYTVPVLCGLGIIMLGIYVARKRPTDQKEKIEELASSVRTESRMVVIPLTTSSLFGKLVGQIKQFVTSWLDTPTTPHGLQPLASSSYPFYPSSSLEWSWLALTMIRSKIEEAYRPFITAPTRSQELEGSPSPERNRDNHSSAAFPEADPNEPPPTLTHTVIASADNPKDLLPGIEKGSGAGEPPPTLTHVPEQSIKSLLPTQLIVPESVFRDAKTLVEKLTPQRAPVLQIQTLNVGNQKIFPRRMDNSEQGGFNQLASLIRTANGTLDKNDEAELIRVLVAIEKFNHQYQTGRDSFLDDQRAPLDDKQANCLSALEAIWKQKGITDEGIRELLDLMRARANSKK